MSAPTDVELRRGVLAVSVLHDVDVVPAALGVTLPGVPDVWISWSECRRALAGFDPETTGRRRLADWLRARRWAADLSTEHLLQRLRPVGLPVEHVLHPGLDWVRHRVLGDALDLGLGAVDLDPADPDRVVLLPSTVLDHAGLDQEVVWSRASAMLDDLGALAAERVKRDLRGQLRPLGDCDVITLLGSRRLRAALAEEAGGMGAAVVPMRRRGWTRLALIDPAFGPAAAAATSEAERGFLRPLLITADELTLVAEGGRPEQIVLRDPAADAPWAKDVLYR
ncbi:MAG: hypothetical protein LC789_17220 [Actinobacteria bacterium]|nr:hypothetical protein [Actinomycetota bacterium]MCA1722525.1 hypothetical protein [Actinomycetota bacterium]